MLTATSEYALRALTHMASLPASSAVLGRDLAAAAGVPPDYLSKIMLALRNAGLVGAARGPGGGYRLLRQPSQIRLLDVVEVFEAGARRPRCLLGSDRECSSATACAAHPAYQAVRDAYAHFLEDTTLLQISVAASATAHGGTQSRPGSQS